MQQLSLEKVYELILKEYNKSINSLYVRKPISHALYTVWKYIDSIEKERCISNLQIVNSNNDIFNSILENYNQGKSPEIIKFK